MRRLLASFRWERGASPTVDFAPCTFAHVAARSLLAYFSFVAIASLAVLAVDLVQPWPTGISN